MFVQVVAEVLLLISKLLAVYPQKYRLMYVLLFSNSHHLPLNKCRVMKFSR